MMLLTTADDFGWDEDTVVTTIDLLERGIVRNASIMANVAATSLALDYAADHPEHGWGVHLTFTRDDAEAPILAAHDVPDLIDESGRFLPGRPAQIGAATGRFPTEQLVAEMTAQLQRVIDHGVAIDYVDSHKHLHKYPGFGRALEQVLPHFGIHTVRRPQNHFVGSVAKRPSAWFGPVLTRRISSRWATSDHFFMADGDPDVDWWDHIDPTIEGSLEIGCHPGTAEPWRNNERQGIERVVQRLDVAPLRWRDLATANTAV